MKKLFLKSIVYSLLFLIVLEIIVRVCHLTKDYPKRIIDKNGVERWEANQEGFSVTGNRRQNFSKFRINKAGFNSYREFLPSINKKEIALLGDSFIEGFHQDYNKSIGKKIENSLPGYQVYEYGYAGYDLADQLHLIKVYKKEFDLINQVFIRIDFNTDLFRSKYSIVKSRMKLEQPLYRNLRKIKMLTYLSNIGVLSAIQKRLKELISLNTHPKKEIVPYKGIQNSGYTELNLNYMNNFIELVTTYGFDKERYVLLIESVNTPSIFINYLNSNKFKFVDLSLEFKKSKEPTTLIYDQHWNNHGRSLVARSIVNEIKKSLKED